MKLKKVGIYLGFLIAVTFMFSFCYYFSYEHALNKFNSKSVEQNGELVSYLKEISKEQAKASEKESLYTQVDTINEARVMPNTVYKLESYDVTTKETKIETFKAPGKFIGLSRDELISLIAEEMQNMSLSDYQKGLVSYVLVSFSKDEIVLRKSYNPDLIQYKYYLAINDGEVIVYYSDRKTIYECTKIQVNYLSEKVQAELSLGRYVKDETELYSLLESYSS